MTYPNGPGPLPVVLYSHGDGGSGDDARPLAVVHRGCDTGQCRGRARGQRDLVVRSVQHAGDAAAQLGDRGHPQLVPRGRAVLVPLLVEGGGRLAGALLERGMVDRYYWVQSPLWLGSRAVPAVVDLSSQPIARAERWTVVERRALGDDTLLVVDCR